MSEHMSKQLEMTPQREKDFEAVARGFTALLAAFVDQGVELRLLIASLRALAQITEEGLAEGKIQDKP